MLFTVLVTFCTVLLQDKMSALLNIKQYLILLIGTDQSSNLDDMPVGGVGLLPAAGAVEVTSL